ncbi:hypothetical protein CEXT_646541 [Caerostris extrusa]|uniref:Uncharacterized protein n=1 Tax=Caerostris extrusa TaxID=172846 RepID=A0AAV4U941_CAEEX|nr:hypothetical protein CEXT_646541 [Caerostris extrusa]
MHRDQRFKHPSGICFWHGALILYFMEDPGSDTMDDFQGRSCSKIDGRPNIMVTHIFAYGVKIPNEGTMGANVQIKICYMVKMDVYQKYRYLIS